MLPGYLAAGAWLALAVVTAAGVMIHPGLIANLVMAVAFACGGAFLVVRAKAVAMVRKSHKDSPQVVRLMRIEAASSLMVLIFGLVCLSGVLHRVLNEGVPVFG